MTLQDSDNSLGMRMSAEDALKIIIKSRKVMNCDVTAMKSTGLKKSLHLSFFDRVSYTRVKRDFCSKYHDCSWALPLPLLLAEDGSGHCG